MPIVPRQTDPRVQRSATPGVRATPESMGAPTPPIDTGPVLQVAYGIAERYRERADQVAVLDADNALHDLGTKLLYDPDAGIMHAKGRTALERTQKLKEVWEKEVGTMATKLTGEKQKQAFRQRAMQRWSSLYEATERHVGSEMRQYEDGVVKAAVTKRVNDALTNYTDPALVNQAIAETKVILTDYAQGPAGQSPEWLEQQVAESTSQIHVGVLTRMLSAGDDLNASKYYAENKGGVVGTDRATIERALEEGSSDGQAHRFAADVLSKTPDLTRTGAREAVSGIENDAVRRKALANLTDAIQAREQDERDQQDELFNQASLDAEKGKAPSPSVRVALTHNMRQAIDALLERAKGGKPGETEWGTYYGLLRMAKDPRSRGAFLQRNLLLDKAKLGDTEFKELARLQTELNAGKSADDVLRGHLTVDEVVNRATSGLFPKVPKKGSVEDLKLTEITRAIDRDIITWRSQNAGKEIPTDIAQDIADRHTLRVTIDRAWWRGDLNELARDVEEDDKGNAIVPFERIETVERDAIQSFILRVNPGATNIEKKVERIRAAQLVGRSPTEIELIAREGRPR